MGECFTLKDGRNVCVFDEGNNIIMVILGTARSVKWLVLRNDFLKELLLCNYADDIYMSYITVGREIVWEELISEKRIVLYKYSDDENVKLIGILCTDDVKCILCIKKKNTGAELGVVYARLGIDNYRKVCGLDEMCEDALLVKHDGDFYLFSGRECIYRIEPGEIPLVQNIKADEDELLAEAEERFRSKLEEQHRYYKKQYDELEELARSMQEEGKRWRQMYYRRDNSTNT